MAEKEFHTRIVHKHDTQANWEKAIGFIPKQGELIVYDVDENYDYQRIKIGDGIKNVNILPFYNDGFVTSVNGVTGDIIIETEIVKYIEQTLTDEQKAQAQANIGIKITTDDDAINMLADLNIVSPLSMSDGSIITSPTGKIYYL